jgi:hypothetical protein
MAFLDRITNRSAQQPVAQNKQEPPKEEFKIENLPAHVKAQAVEAARPSARIMDAMAKALEKRTSHSGHADGREALIRNLGAQGKEQSAMSPTDHSKSLTATQARTQGRAQARER